jgi:hypothetical protein
MHRALNIFYFSTSKAAPPRYGTWLRTAGIAARNYILSHPLPSDDFRTADAAWRLLEKYSNEHQYEPFQLVTDARTGRPLIELAFNIPIGTVSWPGHNDAVPVIWCGKIDLLTLWPSPEGHMTLDHKTSSIKSDATFDGFENDQSQLGYVWAIRKLLNLNVTGFIINMLIHRRPTRTGVEIEFVRRKYYTPPERLVEWEENALWLAQSYIDYCIKGYFPMHSPACVGKYRKCDYFQVCTLPPSDRTTLLNSGLYKNNEYLTNLIPHAD